MLAKFDPIRERKMWLDYGLKVETEFTPEVIPPTARPGYVSQIVNSAIDAYWVGLADQVRPTLEKIIVWMEAESEPDRNLFSNTSGDAHDGWFTVYTWRRSLGLCKWLSRGDNGQRHFATALEAQWQHVNGANPPERREELRESLSQCLAIALAANTPAIGLKFYDAANVKRVSNDQAPLLQFGKWACDHLARGGNRDATFVARGADMLRASLLPNFFWGGNRTEPALWLKAIYWDSGVANTPEQAIARAYDSMPGVERPDFVPR